MWWFIGITLTVTISVMVVISVSMLSSQISREEERNDR